jgi:hypothetical protein
MKFVPDGRKFEIDGQEYELKGWMVNDDPKPIYLDKVPVCIMPANEPKLDAPKECRTKYGVLEDFEDAKNFYDEMKRRNI